MNIFILFFYARAIFYILAAVPVVPVVWSIPLSIALLIDRKNISFPTKALLVTSVACQGWIIAHTGQELIDIFQEGAWWKHLLQLAKDAGPAYAIGSASYYVGMVSRLGQNISCDSLRRSAVQTVKNIQLASKRKYAEFALGYVLFSEVVKDEIQKLFP